MVAQYIAAGAQAVSALGSLFGGSDGPSNKERFNAMVEQSYLSHEHALKQARELPLAQRQGWEKAGIHPIYGLQGASASFSPSFSTGFNSSGSSLGERISRMGQGMSRAAEALVTERERLSNRLLEAQIKGQELENTSKASQLALNTQAGTPPGVKDVLMERINSNPLASNQEPGAVTDLGFTDTVGGGYAPVKSKDATERLEDDFIGNLAWNLRNRILPSFGLNESPPPMTPPKGYVWKYNPFKQAYTLQKKLGWFSY